MVEFEFYLSDEDYDRLYAVMKVQGKEDMSGNDFAAELLHREIRRLHPERVKRDDYGEIIE